MAAVGLSLVCLVVVLGGVLGENIMTTMRKLSERSTDFGLDLYREAASNGDNAFMSPYSISVALAMLYRGAASTSKSQMEQVMGFNPDENVHSTFKTIHDIVFNSRKNYTLREANKIFSRKDFQILEDFQSDLSTHYNAPVEKLDFATKPNPSREHINKWVEKQTENTIKELLAEGTIDSDTVMVLVNAIYFRGFWKNQFNVNDTTKMDFKVKENEAVKVDMMWQKNHFKYLHNSDYSVLEMPYEGDDVAMYVFLPDEVEGLGALEESLTATKISQDINNLVEIEIGVNFPKFTITKDMSLKAALQGIGMGEMFSDSADLSRIDGTKSLVVSDVVHQAFVEVDEEGTKASASTAAIVAYRIRTHHVIVDHPFIFLIRERATGSTLFMGRVVHPGSTFMSKRSALTSRKDGTNLDSMGPIRRNLSSTNHAVTPVLSLAVLLVSLLQYL